MTFLSEKAAGSHMKKEKIENQNMPYERFLRFGPEYLTESELLAIVLRTGIKGKPAIKLAEEILALADKKRDVFCIQVLSPDELNPKIRGKVHLYDSENAEKT